MLFVGRADRALRGESGRVRASTTAERLARASLSLRGEDQGIRERSRAVRSTWSALDEHGDSVNPLTVTYLNRLSDLLFILSRVASTDSHGGTGDIL
ncbi:MAG: cob(I)alamin adenosyltransferase [Micromonosporaceae bacterium]|nr:cob(I)alamin adenosyltransferase [Micromonosporaceae bacterium]